MMALGLMPGMPAPTDGANNITSGEASTDQTAQVEADQPQQMEGPVM